MAGNNIERPKPTEEQLRAAGVNIRPLEKADRQAANRERAQLQNDREDAELSPLNQEARDAERKKDIQRRSKSLFDEF
tara:strand:+ start:10287 stop:10520 length:234 start_codon:yes stop_codon:yes gene_type:complete